MFVEVLIVLFVSVLIVKQSPFIQVDGSVFQPLRVDLWLQALGGSPVVCDLGPGRAPLGVSPFSSLEERFDLVRFLCEVKLCGVKHRRSCGTGRWFTYYQDNEQLSRGK